MKISDLIRLGELKAKIQAIDFSTYPRTFFNPDFRESDFDKEITIGNQFFFIIDLLNFENVYTSKSTDRVLGYGLEKYPFTFGMSKIHPDDRDVVYKSMVKLIEIIGLQVLNKVPVYNNVFNLTYRLQLANGDYMKFLNQNSCYRVEENKNLLYFISTFVDITYLNTPDDVHLSYSGPKSELFTFPDEELLSMVKHIPVFSSRENEILRLMFEGKTTQEISEILNISYNTAKTHRQNMLKKSGFQSSPEMISYWRKNKLF